MTLAPSERVRWTTADLELLPENSNRYEIIDGVLFVTRAPHLKHQDVAGRLYAHHYEAEAVLTNWGSRALEKSGICWICFCSLRNSANA
jgi:hypothetical protein